MATVHKIQMAEVHRPRVALFAAEAKRAELVRLLRSHAADVARLQLTAQRSLAGELLLELDVDLDPLPEGDLVVEATVRRVAGVICLRDGLFQDRRPLRGLLDACDVFQLPVATNAATASMLLRDLAASREAPPWTLLRHPSSFARRHFS